MKRNLIKLICITTLSAICTTTSAQQISLDEAASVARSCMSGSHGMKAKGNTTPLPPLSN